MVGAGIGTECRGASRGTSPGACGLALAAIQADDQRARALLEDAAALSQEAAIPSVWRGRNGSSAGSGRWRPGQPAYSLEEAAAGFRALNAPGCGHGAVGSC